MIDNFWNICLLHDITTRDQLLREAVRVVQTKRTLEKQVMTQDTLHQEELFQWMKLYAGEREFGHFPGDQELFYKLYQVGKEIDLIDYAIQTLQQDRITGGLLVHTSVVERFFEMCKINQYQSLLIVEVEKYLTGLRAAQLYNQSFELTLLTENYVLAKLLRVYFEDHLTVHIIQGSIYNPLPLKDTFEAVLSTPNFGMKIDDVEETELNQSEAMAVNHLLPLLSESGKLQVILPARMIFQSGKVAIWREETNEKFPVQSIYSLPDAFLRPYTSVKCYQIEFGKQHVKQVEIGRLFISKDKLSLQQETFVTAESFVKLDDWRIDLLLDQDQTVIRAYQEASVPKVKLKDIAEIFRGKSILKQDLKPGNTKVLNISNIEDGEVKLEQLETIDEEERKIKRYEILPGDLVMTCRGTVIKFAIFPPTKDFVIASANIIVIRFKGSNMISGFAKIFLESPVGSTLIQSFQRGTNVMNLNPSDVGGIELPLLSLDEQLNRVKRYDEERERYKHIVREATERWERVKDQLYNELY